MYFTINSFGDFLIFIIVAAVILFITKDDISKDDGNNWDQWRTHK